MNKVIEQKQRKDLTVYVSALDIFVIMQKNCKGVPIAVSIDKQGASEIIKVLQEWIENEDE